MTIRQYIKRRVGLGWGIFVGAWLLNLLVIFCLPTSNGLVGINVVIAICAIAAYISMLFIRCSKCRANLGMMIGMAVTMRIGGREVKYCPYCAVSLDKPMPAHHGRSRQIEHDAAAIP